MTRAIHTFAIVFITACGSADYEMSGGEAEDNCTFTITASIEGGVAQPGRHELADDARIDVEIPATIPWHGEELAPTSEAVLLLVAADGREHTCRYREVEGELVLDTCEREDLVALDVVRAALVLDSATEGEAAACLRRHDATTLPDAVGTAGTDSQTSGTPRSAPARDRATIAATRALPGMKTVSARAVTMAEAVSYYTSLDAQTREPSVSVAAIASTTVQPPASIAELARALRYDVDLIHEYVHDNIVFTPGWGLRKNPAAAILDQAGNAFDQANLMAELLRESNYTAHVVMGTITVAAADVEGWLGTKHGASVWKLVANSGMPVEQTIEVDSSGNLVAMHMGHVWVRATGKELGSAYYHFDPARKRTTVMPAAMSVAAAMGYSRADVLAAAGGGDGVPAGASLVDVDRTALRAKLHAYATNLVDYVQSNHRFDPIDRILGGRPIRSIVGLDPTRDPANPKLKPGTTPTVWTGAVPSSLQPTLRIQLGGIDKTFATADLGGKRLTIRYGTDYKAVLRLDGVVVATATTAGTNGSVQEMKLTINEPYAARACATCALGTYADTVQPMSLPVRAQNVFAVLNGWGETAAATVEHHRQRSRQARASGSAATSDEVLGETLQQLAALWLAQRSRIAALMEKAHGSLVIAHHFVGVVGQTTGPYVDIPIASVSPIGKTIGFDPTGLFVMAGFGSALESTVIEQTQTVRGVSTVSLFDVAARLDKTLYEATHANWATIKPRLVNYQPREMLKIESYIGEGWRLILPADGDLRTGTWVGYTFLGISPDGDSIAHLISEAKGGFPSDPVAPEATSVGIEASNEPATSSGGRARSQPTSGDPVNVATGDFIHTTTDLRVGPTDAEIVLERTYNSGASLADGPLGRGWAHNLDIRVDQDSDGFQALGADSVADAAAAIVALHVTRDLLGVDKGLRKLTIATLAQQWASEALVDNSATVKLVGSHQQFIRVPHGVDSANALRFRYLPPPGLASRLTQGTTWRLESKTREVMTFDATGKVVSIANPNGIGLTFSYVSGLLATVTHSYGWKLELTYVGSRIATVKDGAGRTVTYGYTGKNLTSVQDPRLHTTTFSYAGVGRLASIFYPSAPTTAFVTNRYDSLGRVMEQLDAYGHITRYFIAGSRSEERDALGGAKVWYFDDNARVVRFIDQRQRTIRHSYDGQQNLVATALPEGNEIRRSYDNRYNEIEVRHTPKAGTAELVSSARFHTTWNKPEWTRDGRGNQVDFVYDANGRLAKRIDPVVDGVRPTTLWTSNTRGQLASMTDPTGRVTQYAYAELGKKTLKTVTVDPGGESLITEYHHDAAGNVDAVTNPRGFTTITHYNDNRQPTRVERPVPVTGEPQPVSETSYDQVGHVVEERHQLGTNWIRQRRTYDLAGRLATVSASAPTIDTSTPKTRYAYDAAGRLESITDREGRVTRYERYADGSERVVYRAYGTTAQIREAAYTYTDNGKLASITDAKGNQTTFLYDAYDRLRKTLFPSATTGEPNATDFELLGYDPASNVTSVRTRRGAAFTFEYDALNRQRRRLGGNLPVVATDYDRAGRVSRVRYEDGTHAISYAYDGAGRLTTINDKVGTWLRTVGLGYDKTSSLAKLTWPDGYFVTYHYDAASRLREIKEMGTTVLATIDRDHLSRRKSVVRGGTTTTYSYWSAGPVYRLAHDAAGTDNDVTFTYDYNHENQLTGLWSSNAAYVYAPPAISSTTYVPNGLNQYATIGSEAQDYDAAGNLASSAGITFAHDALGRLVSATLGSTLATYDYDPLGRRVKKTVNAASAQVLYAGLTEIADYSSTNTLIRRYIPGEHLDEIVAITEGAAKRYPLHDHVGSVIGVANASGGVTQQFTYGPFGEHAGSCQPWQANCTRFRWAGRPIDAETGLVHMRARTYSPATGRFLEPDPMGYVDGPNVYAYAQNDPVNRVDPLGTDSQPTAHSGSSSGNAVRAFYVSRDEAAFEALTLANPRSIRDNREYGGLIYRDSSGNYGITGPIRGSEQGVNPSAAPAPAGTTVVGDYHTHGAYSRIDPQTGRVIRTDDPRRDDFNSDNFSRTDRLGIRSDAEASGADSYAGYLGTPSGQFLRFDPATGRSEPLRRPPPAPTDPNWSFGISP